MIAVSLETKYLDADFTVLKKIVEAKSEFFPSKIVISIRSLATADLTLRDKLNRVCYKS